MKMKDEVGASLVEYALLLSLISALSVAIAYTIGQYIAEFFAVGNVLNP